MALPVIEGFTKANSGNTAEVTLTAVRPDPAPAAGELLVLICVSDVNNETVVYADNKTGWNFVGQIGYAGDASMGVFTKIATGSEGATEDITQLFASRWCVFYIRISGGKLLAHKDIFGTDPGTEILVLGVTTTIDDCLILYGVSHDGGDGFPFSVSGTGWVEKDEEQSQTNSSGSSGCWGARDLATQGASGTATVTAQVTDGAVFFQMAIEPSAGVDHDLTPDDVQSLSEVDSPVITQVHDLTVTDVESASEVDSSALTQVHDLTATDAESTSELDSPALTQVHTLTPTDIQSTSEVDEPVLTVITGADHDLTPTDIESASEVDNPALTQVHVLVATDAESASEVDSATLTQVHILTAGGDLSLLDEDGSDILDEDGTSLHDESFGGVESKTEVSTPALTQVHILVPSDIESVSEVDAPVVTQIHQLTPTNVESVSEVDTPVLTGDQIHDLTPVGVQSLSEVDEPALSQLHIIIPSDLISLSEVSSPLLIEFGTGSWVLEDAVIGSWTEEDAVTDGWTEEDSL